MRTGRWRDILRKLSLLQKCWKILKKTLERRTKLNLVKMRKFLKAIRKKNGNLKTDDDFPLDDMNESEFTLVMALRSLEREEAVNTRSPRFAQKTQQSLKKARLSLSKLNAYVNSPRKDETLQKKE
mmetsp:Transcript_10209/g.37945  ORF Transcript_10209/g.37945 Transcript_10209/m.37945 type:complete len:126 (+) Transcript_10209:5438-5815(+)